MQIHRLIIHRNERLLGHFDSDVPWSREAVQDIAARLPKADGYRLELLVASEQQRVLESGPNGVRLLYSTPLFTPTSLPESS